MCFPYIWSKSLSSSLNAMLTQSKTTLPPNLLQSDDSVPGPAHVAVDDDESAVLDRLVDELRGSVEMSINQLC